MQNQSDRKITEVLKQTGADVRSGAEGRAVLRDLDVAMEVTISLSDFGSQFSQLAFQLENASTDIALRWRRAIVTFDRLDKSSD